MSKVSVIIPTMKGREAMLERLIKSIPEDIEKIVVNDEDLLLAGKRNRGAELATGDLLLFIDDDNYLEDFAINWMKVRHDRSIGVMGMVGCYSDKKMIVADGGSFRDYVTGFMHGVNTNARVWEIDSDVYDVDEVANAFMIPRDVFESVNGFDEENFPIDLDEADICKRIKDMGYRIVMNPKAICYHDSQTYSHIPDFRRPMNAYFMARNKVLFQKKHLNKVELAIYCTIFLPIFVVGYTVCLLYRRKPNMVRQYWKGTLDGLSGRKENPYQKR